MKFNRILNLTVLFVLLVGSMGCQPVRSTGSIPTADTLPKASPSPIVTIPAAEATSTSLPTATSVTPASKPFVIVPGTGVYVRPPTVQSISPTSATIVFELENSTGYSLVYWPAGSGVEEGQSITLEPQSTNHVIELDGLTPGADYFAAVLSGDGSDVFTAPLFQGEIWDPVRVHTLPQDGSAVRIAVLGDSGFGEELTHDLAQMMADQEPDLFIHTGDLVYNAGQEDTPVEAFQMKFFAALAPILHQAAVFPVVGNHELYDDARWNGRAYYYDVFPLLQGLETSEAWAAIQEGNREWYRVSLGPVQLLFLNTQLFYQGHLRGEQDQWLAERLADESFSYSIPIFHVPPYTSGRHRLDGTPVVRSWVPLFEAGHVPLVLSGHDHNYERLFQNQVTYLVSGGGSSALYQEGRPLDISQVFFAQSHCLIIDLEPGMILIRAYNRDGELLDEKTIGLP